MYRDMEMSADAIAALKRGIEIHECAAQDAVGETSHVSQYSAVGKNQYDLERSGIMKILAEEQIKNG